MSSKAMKPTIKLSGKQAKAVANHLGTLVCPKKNSQSSTANGITLRRLPKPFRKKGHAAHAFRLTADKPELLSPLLGVISENGRRGVLSYTEN